MAMNPERALQILAFARVTFDAGWPDFFTLSSTQVAKLLDYRGSYRKPAGANGSTGRYFYAHVCRAAQREPTVKCDCCEKMVLRSHRCGFNNAI
jgi:hypothetical protein